MNKREMIEGALGQLVEKIVWYYRHGSDAQVSVKELIDAFAQQIVIECEVEHVPGYDALGHSDWVTCLRGHLPLVEGYLDVLGKKGTPGKALAIILSLEESEVTEDVDWLDGECYGAK